MKVQMKMFWIILLANPFITLFAQENLSGIVIHKESTDKEWALELAHIASKVMQYDFNGNIYSLKKINGYLM